MWRYFNSSIFALHVKGKGLLCQQSKNVLQNLDAYNVKVISLHLPYKVKVDYDRSFSLNARLALHENGDRIKPEMRTNCCMCSAIGIRVILSITAVKKQPIPIIAAKSAFYNLVQPNSEFTKFLYDSHAKEKSCGPCRYI